MNTETYELIETLEREFYSFDALQLVAVIEELLEDGGRIFFEADPDMSFPPSDAGYVKIDGGATVRLPIMNLLGSSSPLPAEFSDRIARGGRGAEMRTEFLSVMQNRLHALWIDACRGAFRDASTPLRDASTPLSGPERSRRAGIPPVEKIFKFMTGLPTDKTGFFGSAPCGLWHLSNRTRSAQGLKELLYAAFGGIPIIIEENVGRYASVSNAKPLGGAARLGRNAFAGTRVYDETAKFRLILGPLDRRTYESFMPGGSAARLLDEILSVYLNEPVICELSVACLIRDLPGARLGAEGSGGTLGRTAALGKSESGAAVFMVNLCK